MPGAWCLRLGIEARVAPATCPPAEQPPLARACTQARSALSGRAVSQRHHGRCDGQGGWGPGLGSAALCPRLTQAQASLCTLH